MKGAAAKAGQVSTPRLGWASLCLKADDLNIPGSLWLFSSVENYKHDTDLL